MLNPTASPRRTRHSLCPAHFLGAFAPLSPAPPHTVTDRNTSPNDTLIGFTCATLFAHPALTLSATTDPRSHAPSHPYLVVHSLCVLPPSRGCGVARHLLDATCAVARRDGRRGARLMCHRGAVGMYEGWGWRERGRSAIEYGGGGEEWWEMGVNWEGEEGVVGEEHGQSERSVDSGGIRGQARAIALAAGLSSPSQN